MIDRSRADPDADPLDPLRDALEHGFSLIIFRREPAPHSRCQASSSRGFITIATAFPAVELIPVYIENLHRSMPKGACVPVPIICTVRFGGALRLGADEDKTFF